ncbi:hypothetical protein KI387_019482, partial [Taxus chinensis]
ASSRSGKPEVFWRKKRFSVFIIQGKLSKPDQLSEAIGYIRYLQQKVNDLSKERDEMKSNGKQYCIKEKIASANPFPLVNIKHDDSVVVITTITLREKMLLSKMLLAVEEEGLQLLTLSSFASDDKVYHIIHCKAVHSQSYNRDAELQDKLWQLMGKDYM